jgi:hypothetical protein
MKFGVEYFTKKLSNYTELCQNRFGETYILLKVVSDILLPISLFINALR